MAFPPFGRVRPAPIRRRALWRSCAVRRGNRSPRPVSRVPLPPCRRRSRQRGNRSPSVPPTVCRQFPAIIATETENRHLTKCRNRNETAAPRVCAGACARVSVRVRVVFYLFLYFFLSSLHCIRIHEHCTRIHEHSPPTGSERSRPADSLPTVKATADRFGNGHGFGTGKGSPPCRQTRHNRPPWRSRRSDGFAPAPIPRAVPVAFLCAVATVTGSGSP